MGRWFSMCLRTACYEDEQRIKNLEDQNEELKKIIRRLWPAQFAPLNNEDKKEVNVLMRKNGIEVYP